jgi:hypothetical protein
VFVGIHEGGGQPHHRQRLASQQQPSHRPKLEIGAGGARQQGVGSSRWAGFALGPSQPGPAGKGAGTGARLQGGNTSVVPQAGHRIEAVQPRGGKQGLSRLLGTSQGAGVGKAGGKNSGGRARNSQPRSGGRRGAVSKQPLGAHTAVASQDIDGLFVQPDTTGQAVHASQGGFARFAFGQAAG